MAARTETYSTALGKVTLVSNWEALHLAFRRRSGGAPGPKAVKVVALRMSPAEVAQWEGADNLLSIMDAKVRADSEAIYAAIPDPSFCAGVIIDWLWLAVAKFCKPEGWEFLHAAAVAQEDGVTLIIGPSGAGKTTALLAMLDAGAQYLSDDAVLYDKTANMIYPWTRDLHLLPEQVKPRWPELIGDTLDFNGKIRLTPQTINHVASEGGKLKRAIVLAEDGKSLNLSHEGIGLTTEIGLEMLTCPVEFWGVKPPDMRERIETANQISCPPLAILTPFSGKRWALEEWITAFLQLEIPAGAHLLWLCNSADDEFYRQLQEQAALLAPTYHILLWRDQHKVGIKDRQVSYLWQQIRTRVPESVELIMTLEDDVLPDKQTFRTLLREWKRRGGRDMVGLPVAHTYMHGETTALAWNYEPATKQTDPRFLVNEWVAAREAMPKIGPNPVGGLSFSCALFSRELFDSASLAPAGDAYPAGGYDHQFCLEAAEQGREVVAWWGIGSSHLKLEGGVLRQVRLDSRKILLIGDGADPGNGARYQIAGRCAEAELPDHYGEADYAVWTSAAISFSPAYLDALVDYLTWHPQVGIVWGYVRQADGRMVRGADAGALVRLLACRDSGKGDLDSIRQYLATEGWLEHHTDRASCLAKAEPPKYRPARDPKRDVAAFKVLMLNRDRYRGGWPGFGGDFTQIHGYRRGLRALGIYADLRGGQFWWHDGYQLIHLHHHQYDWAWEAAETCDGKRPVVLSAITHGHPTKDIMERAVGLADYIVCYSESEAAFIASRFPEKRGRLRVVPMGVDPILYSSNGKVEPQKSVFMAGKICGYKGQLAVLEACRYLDIPVRFAGFNEDPVHDPYIDEFIAAVAKYPKAEWLGFLQGEDLWNEYRRAQVHVNASQFEPFGQVTLDALALGCNIVHSKNSWSADMFGRVGSLCEPDNVDSIAAAIETEMKRTRGWAKVKPPTYVEAAQALAAVYWEALAR